MVLFLSPAPHRMKDRDRRVTCASQLAKIGLAFKTWAIEGANAYPMQVAVDNGGTRELAGTGLAFVHFQVLSNELSNAPSILVCPADKRAAASDFARLSNTNLSYFVGLDVPESNPQMLLAGDRNLTNGTPLPPNRILVLTTNTTAGWTHELHNGMGNVVLADGSVQQVTSSRLRDQFAQGGETNRLAIP